MRRQRRSAGVTPAGPEGVLARGGETPPGQPPGRRRSGSAAHAVDRQPLRALRVRSGRLRRRGRGLHAGAAAAGRCGRRSRARRDHRRRRGRRGIRRAAALLALRSVAEPTRRQDRRRRAPGRIDRRGDRQADDRPHALHRRSLRPAAHRRHVHRPHRLLPRRADRSHRRQSDESAVGDGHRGRRAAASRGAVRDGVPDCAGFHAAETRRRPLPHFPGELPRLPPRRRLPQARAAPDPPRPVRHSMGLRDWFDLLCSGPFQ